MTTQSPTQEDVRALIDEARARFELLKRQDKEIDGNDIHLIRSECSVTMAKAVVNLKGAAQWAAEYGDRLATALQECIEGNEQLKRMLSNMTDVAQPVLSGEFKQLQEAAAAAPGVGIRPVEQMVLDQMTPEQHRECGCAACLRILAALHPIPEPK